MKLSQFHFALLRIIVGALFVGLAVDKLGEGWLTDAEPLRTSLTEYRQRAAGVQAEFLDSVAIPYAGIWSKLILLGEAGLGISLVFGLLVRLSCLAGLFMLLNFYAANGNLFSWKFLTSPWSGVIFTCMLIFILARAGRWAGFDALLARKNAKGFCW